MSVLRVLFLFTVVSSVLGDTSSSQPVTPCQRTDLNCLKIVVKEYLMQTAKGIPEYHLLPLDPMEIDGVIFRETKHVKGATIVIKKIILYGLENQELTDFSMDPKLGFVKLTTRTNITIFADIYVEHNNQMCTGWIDMGAIMDIDSDYTYNIRSGIDGRKHYLLGPEITKASIVTGYHVNIIWLSRSQDAESGKFEMEYREILKTLVEKAYVRVIQNLRTAATFIPKEEFLIMPQHK